MEKGKSAVTGITSSLKSLNLNPTPKAKPSSHSFQSLTLLLKKSKPRRLVSLCLGVLGQHFEDIHADLIEITAGFPADIKLAMVAIARRKKLLNDDVLLALAENSWVRLDLSGSDVTDVALEKVAQICTYLRAVDISRCEKITAAGVSDLIYHCRSLEILRCGGCLKSDRTAQKFSSILKPKLNNVEEESWEELDSMDIGNGAESLRWLVWPDIDGDSRTILATECPRIVVNPKPSCIGFRGIQIPAEALANAALDDPIMEDIDPRTWAVTPGAARGALVLPASADASEIPKAERFRLAYVEKDARLAPKRAKNERQNRRRAGREWLMISIDAKSLALASQESKFLHDLS